MRKKKINSILAGVLAVAMVLTSVPMDVRAAGNLALNKSVKASSYEVASTAPEKAVDGDVTTRWGTDRNKAAGEYIEVNLGSAQQIAQIVIRFERTDDAQNILGYHVDLDEETVYTKNTKASQVEKITFDEVKTATKLRVTIDEANGGTINWVNVGINEIEVYAEAGAISLDEVVSALEGTADNTIEYYFELPEVPEGYEIELNGVDFEYLVQDDQNVRMPLVDKEVKISYKITETATGETAITDDIAYIVKGEYEQKAGMNEKPVVIPEIQEWYSWTNEKVSLDGITAAYYDSDDLEPVVDEFIADYEAITGRKLEKTMAKAGPGQFNFMRNVGTEYLGEEGYLIDIADGGVVVCSECLGVTGYMYGAQTILQMVKQNSGELPIGRMRDYPRFEVRGLLLDIARKPIGMEMIRDIARTMRYYKMNDFQLHLSDNYIFLENYGKGANENEAFKAYEAYRLECDVKNDAGESPTAKDYYITKDEMREFIQEQRALGMNIIPEIDMPAHATSFTKIWPELMVVNKVSPLNGNRPLVDHFDVSRQEAIDKIKEIFDDYTTGNNPTFDAETIVHVGADEFVANSTAYRQFVNQIVPHVKQTNKVRMWGGFTWLDDHKTEIAPEAIENVEMNLWSKDWADGLDMYNLGYKLINTIDDYGYMVPDGSLGRANAYGDLLNVSRIFDSFEANKVRTKNGYVALPSGSDQVLGAAYAIWSDNIDKHASGLSESDLYYRFFDALPFYAEKTWAATGKEKGSANALAELAAEIGDAPNTNPYYQEDRVGKIYESYDFENGLEDTSENDRDLTAGTAEVKDGTLTLAGGNSYVTSPIEKLGNGNELIFDITLTEEAQPGDILFEATPEYGTHDIRIMDNGKLGFTRELYDYYFDYELPVGEKVNIKIYAEQQTTTLFVNGKMIGTAVGRFFHNDMLKKDGITYATFALPLERIGSATNAIAAVIDNVVVKVNTDPKPDDASNDLPVDGIKVTAGTVEPSEGSLEALLDGDPNSFYHSNWSGARPSNDDFWITLELPEVTEVSGLRYLPRQSSANGRILSYVVSYSLDGNEWTEVAAGDWADNGSWKIAAFGENVEAKYVKIFATDSKADNSGRHLTGAELRLVKAVEEEKPDVPIGPAKQEVCEIYPDVIHGEWYEAAVQYVHDNGIMTGSNGLFKPTGDDGKLLRQQFVMILWRMEGEPKAETDKAIKDLQDINGDEWYIDALCWAYENGVVTGVGGTMFKGNDPITRQQLATMMYRYAGKMGYDTSKTTDYSNMPGANDVESYAAEAMAWAVGSGIISGSGAEKALNPAAGATRAQIATIIQRFCEENNL